MQQQGAGSFGTDGPSSHTPALHAGGQPCGTPSPGRQQPPLGGSSSSSSSNGPPHPRLALPVKRRAASRCTATWSGSCTYRTGSWYTPLNHCTLELVCIVKLSLRPAEELLEVNVTAASTCSGRGGKVSA